MKKKLCDHPKPRMTNGTQQGPYGPEPIITPYGFAQISKSLKKAGQKHENVSMGVTIVDDFPSEDVEIYNGPWPPVEQF